MNAPATYRETVVEEPIFEFHGALYPSYLKGGNAMQFVMPAALHFCTGRGLDVGASRWPLPGAIPIDLASGGDAMNLPEGPFDFIFSSHMLEHAVNHVAALEHWKTRLKRGGVLYLNLPHPDMKYWRPTFCRRHLSLFWPADVAEMLRDLGFVNVLHSERDMYWSFSVVGFVP